MTKHIIISFFISALLLGTAGCGEQKYKLTFEDPGLESGKTRYAAGEEVVVYYPHVATDTDYYFSAGDDIDLEQAYDYQKGITLSFVMPARDVSISVDSRNTMTFDPDAIVNPGEPWVCPECGTDNYGKFCSQCGEERPTEIGDWTSKIESNNLVFDYYDATVATIGGDHYTEFVLYSWDGEGLILARYTKSEGGEEKCLACQVPEKILSDCMQAVQKSGLQQGSDEGGITGRRLVVKYKKGDQMIRISSEETGDISGFNSVSVVLGKAWSQYYVPGDDENSGSTDQSIQVMTEGSGAADADGNDSAAVQEEGDPWFCPECGRRNTGSVCLDCGLEKPDK